MTSIVIPNSVTIIGTGAFDGCSSLTGVTVGNSVTSIGKRAFGGCTSLTSIVIPSSVTGIGERAFSGCSGLTSMYFSGNAPFFYEYDSLPQKVTVYSLPGTTGWGRTFASRPTAPWLPQVLAGDASFGVRTNQFGFNIAWASGQTVIVDACTGLTDGAWVPLQTNTLAGDSTYFSDPDWADHPARFYRVRSL